MSNWHENIEKKYKHRVIKAQIYTSDASCWQGIEYSNAFIEFSNGRLLEKVGYAWDGASGPVFQTEALVDASARHDGLYQVISNLVGYHPDHIEAMRIDADRCLRWDYMELCLKAYPGNTLKHRIGRAIAKKRANYIHWAVRKFGGKHIKKK